MEQEIITVYCLIDDLLKGLNIQDNKKVKMSNAEVITIAYFTMKLFAGNYAKAYKTIVTNDLFNLIKYEGFIKRINKLSLVIDKIFNTLGKIFTNLNETQIYSIDSFPVEVCRIEREKQCKLLMENKFKGFNSTKDNYFYGFKVHMIVTTDREPVSVYIGEASQHDLVGARILIPQLPEESITIGDKAYNSKEFEDDLKSINRTLMPLKKKNMKGYKLNKNISKIRKSVEIAFSVLTGNFGKVIKATSINGFIVKLKMFILVYSFDMKFKNNYYKHL